MTSDGIMRISVVCFKAGKIFHFGDFADHVTRLCHQAAEQEPDLILFPELLTFELLDLTDSSEFSQKFLGLTRYTEDYLYLFTQLARDLAVEIVGGSHPMAVNGKIYNTATLFTAAGRIRQQQKCHLIPVEAPLVSPGETITVFHLAKASISILTCYDIEFPEAVRLAALKGAEIVLTPSATVSEHGYWRVRHCAQARCIENQIFVAACSLLGRTAGLNFVGQGAILSPCDTHFPTNGVLAESAANVETVLTADLDLKHLNEIRASGEVSPLQDIREDLLTELCNLKDR